MMGPESNPGVNRRAIAELVRITETNRGTLETTLAVSMFEIYNEKVFDLLAPEGRTRREVKVGAGGVYVKELSERVVQSQAEVEAAMADGHKHRSTASTDLNAHSSRSHMVFQVSLRIPLLSCCFCICSFHRLEVLTVIVLNSVDWLFRSLHHHSGHCVDAEHD